MRIPSSTHRGTIGTVTVVLESELVVPKTPGLLKRDAPTGLVERALQ